LRAPFKSALTSYPHARSAPEEGLRRTVARAPTCCNVGWCAGGSPGPAASDGDKAAKPSSREADDAGVARVAWCVLRIACQVLGRDRAGAAPRCRQFAWRERGRNPCETVAADHTSFFRCRLADFVPLDRSSRLSQKYRCSIPFHFRCPGKSGGRYPRRLIPRSMQQGRPCGRPCCRLPQRTSSGNDAAVPWCGSGPL
jgi:hypothetical protein